MGFLAAKRADKKIAKMGSGAHAAAPRNERTLMRKLGGTVVPRSGAGLKKGDGQIKGLARIEAKGTTKDSFRITKGLLAKTDMAALSAGEYPIHVIQFLSAAGAVEDELAVIRLSDLQELLLRCQSSQS